MVANTSPIFTLTPNIAFASLTTATSAQYTGAGTNTSLIHTAGSNGSFVTKLTAEAAGTNVATVMMIFINNGSSVGTAANNTLIGSMTLAATTGSATGATQHYEYPLNIQLPAGYKIYVALGTTVASGWAITAIAGDY